MRPPGAGAGLRTYTLVGLGSALFMLISKYGVAALAAELGEIDVVLGVAAGDVNEMFD